MMTNRPSKRFMVYGLVFLALMIVVVSLVSAAYGGDHLFELTPKDTLNWLGVLITVFSLAVTFFLAVMAIEAFSHMNHLREATEKYTEFSKRLEEDEQRFETAQIALNHYNTEMLSLVDFYVQQSQLDDVEKIRFSKKFQVARARLELSNLQSLHELSFDSGLSHVLVLAEHGRISDLKYALSVLKSLNDPLVTMDLASNIADDIVTRERSAPFRSSAE